MSTPDLLDDLKIASPCGASWKSMKGDDRVRCCDHCFQRVYNLSAMTRSEARELMESREGRVCIRFYRRRDGTVLTRDCPRGQTALRLRALNALAVLLAMAALLLSFVVGPSSLRWTPVDEWSVWDIEPLKSLFGKTNSSKKPVMGEFCPPIGIPAAPLQKPELPRQF